MSTLIEIAAILPRCPDGAVVLAVMAVINGRKERRKNIRFHETLDLIESTKDPDELIAIRDAYRDELGNPLNL